jgi:hypothetical protein
MAGMDRAIASPHELAALTAGYIITCGDTIDPLRDWPADAARAVVLAYAINAPEDVLEDMAHAGDRQVEWCEWWDREGYDESQRVPGAEVP